MAPPRSSHGDQKRESPKVEAPASLPVSEPDSLRETVGRVGTKIARFQIDTLAAHPWLVTDPEIAALAPPESSSRQIATVFHDEVLAAIEAMGKELGTIARAVMATESVYFDNKVVWRESYLLGKYNITHDVYRDGRSKALDLILGHLRSRKWVPADRLTIETPEEPDIKAVLAATGWQATLRSLYPEATLLEFAGSVWPIAVFDGEGQASDNLETAVGTLSEGMAPDARTYGAEYDHAGVVAFEQLCDSADPKRTWNGLSFCFDRLRFEDGVPKVDAGLGRYFRSLVTSEVLDAELMAAQAINPAETVQLSQLPRRQWLRDQVERVAGPGSSELFHGNHRDAALSVAMVVMYRTERGYQILLSPRSTEVATHKLFNHVMPAGIFQPQDWARGAIRDEFRVKTSLLREYLEELYSLDKYQIARHYVNDPYSAPQVRRMLQIVDEGSAHLVFTGLSINLLTLRPEFCALLFVTERDWLADESRLAESEGIPFRLNWEALELAHEGVLPKGRIFMQALEVTTDFELVHPDRMNPVDCIPNAGAAVALALRAARGLH